MKKTISSIGRAVGQQWPLLVIGMSWCCLFWPMLVGETVIGFRDSSYLYYPLFHWIDSVWASGEIPLWNPFDNFGTPVVADGSSSVFYPGKLIFLFRFISYESRYGLFIASHVLLAAVATFLMAKGLRCQNSGATLAAISYAFGGSLLFQTTNVIYLISAAWLPLAMLGVWKIRNQRSLQPAIITGVALAMIILGGDPQMVYNIGLVLAATLVGGAIRQWARRRRGSPNMRGRPTPTAPLYLRIDRFKGVKQLLTVVCVTTTLAAIQLLPTFEWSQDSVRKRFETPRNVYELFTQPESGPKLDHDHLLNSLVQKPAPDRHADHIYQFSQPPWTLIELAWPNIGGMAYPTHQRWYASLPGNERMWTPSLYVGCLTLLLSFISLRFFGPRRKQVWISRWTLFFGVASLGWFGIVWLINELFSAPDQFSEIAPQVGGLYWLMVTLLPKYVMFRYPAKLFIFASLGICLLAGMGLDQISRELRDQNQFGPRSRVANRGMKMLLVLATALLSCSVLMTVLLTRPAILQRLSQIPADPIWGPFNLIEATFTYLTATSHTFFTLLILVFTSVLCLRYKTHQVWVSIVLLAATLDVGIANYRLLPQVPAATFTNLNATTPAMQGVIPAYPAHWREESSKERLSEVVHWQRENQFPKWHLPHSTRNLQSFSSIESSYDAAISANAGRIGLSEIPQYSLRRGFHVFDLKDHHWRFPLHNDLVGTAATDSSVRIAKESTNGIQLLINTTDDDVFLCAQEMMGPGWKAQIVDQESGQTSEVPIARWLGTFRAVKVPPGQSSVEFRYEPPLFYWGATISATSLCLLVVLLFTFQFRGLFNARRLKH